MNEMRSEAEELKYQLDEVTREINNSVSAADDCRRRLMDADAQTLMDRVLRLNTKRRALLRQQAASAATNRVAAARQGHPVG